MNRTALPGRARIAIAMACAAVCISCTYTLLFANKPKFHPVGIGGMTFTPSIVAGDDGAVLHLRTSRPNPVTDEIDTIRLADIAVSVVAAVGQDRYPPTPAALRQEGNAEVLLESGDLELTADLSANLPGGSSPEMFDEVIITYKGESAVSRLQPVQ